MEQEEKILLMLSDTWNEFLKLQSQHPSEKDYFCDGINKCQHIIAMRIARGARPDLFPIITK